MPNTPLSVSAGELSTYLFSCAGLTLNNRLTSMTDEILENIVLKKKN